ncbi:hypothetical protein Tco_0281996 [Tanacetum coccineum]
MEEAYRFYKSRFSVQLVSRPQLFGNGLPHISSDDANMLETPVEEKEVWDAVVSYGGDKAPRPDGLDFTFIKRGMGFEEKWCSWIDTCLKSSSMSVPVNGSSTIELGLECGVRQGDPLLPFLYILVAQGLNSMVKEAIQKGIFKGVKRVSGLKVNLTKSRLYGVGVNSREVSNMLSWMRCSIGELPFTYLGLPIEDCMRQESA